MLTLPDQNFQFSVNSISLSQLLAEPKKVKKKYVNLSMFMGIIVMSFWDKTMFAGNNICG